MPVPAAPSAGVASPSPPRSSLLTELFPRSNKPPSHSGSKTDDLEVLPTGDASGSNSGSKTAVPHVHAGNTKCNRFDCTAEQLVSRPLSSVDLPEQVGRSLPGMLGLCTRDACRMCLFHAAYTTCITAYA